MSRTTPSKYLWSYGVCLLLCLPTLPLQARKTTILVYPRSESANDTRSQYPLALLHLALNKSRTPFRLQASQGHMQQSRAIVELSQDRTINIIWSMTSREREKILLPIRIPIYKGLLGWRIPLISKKRAKRLKGIRNLKELRRLSFGQGHDWPDTEILRENGFQVYGSPTYAGLFQMLKKDRFSLLPRSILEVWDELRRYAPSGITIQKELLIKYPTAAYFFVSKKNRHLAQTLEKGLNRSIADGSFSRLFYRYNGKAIRRTKIQQRRIFILKNPVLPAKTPLHRKELWYR